MQNHQKSPIQTSKSNEMKTAPFHSKKYISSILKKSLTPMQIFSLLCEIPHKSYHTQEMFEYLCSFCENLGLEVCTDRAKNIYICKKVQKCESKKEPFINMDNTTLPNRAKNIVPKICLQAHYDMVGVGRAECGEAISPYIDGQFLRARESSLGADNGVGVASILWLFMQDKYAPYIEAIFTNDEEVGLCGANELELPIKSRFLLNLDSEFFGEIITGCAGGFDVEFDFGTYCYKSAESMQKEREYGEENLQDLRLYEIEAFGFEGGHSGIDIDKNIRSSIVEFAKLLEVLCEDFDENVSVLYELNAGEKSNSIPVGLHAIMGFGLGMEELKFALKKAGLWVESSKEGNVKSSNGDNAESLCLGVVDFAREFGTKCGGIKTGFLLKTYSQIGDYKQILKQKPYDKRLLAKVVLGLGHGVWERDEEGCVSSSLNVAMIEGNSPLCEGNSSNSPAGSHCIDLLDFEDSQATQPSSPPKSSKNSTSTTSRARIVDSSPQTDFSDSPSPNCQNVAEWARGLVKSSNSVITSEQSECGTSLLATQVANECEALAGTVAKQNLSRIASDLQSTQLATQRDCHARQASLAMTTKTDCHTSLKASLAMTEKERDCYADFDKSARNDNSICRPWALIEVSQQTTHRDISPTIQYDKNINSHNIDCIKSSMRDEINTAHSGTNQTNTMPKSLHFTLKARANTNALLAKSKAQITDFIHSSLQSPQNQNAANSPKIRISNQYSAWANEFQSPSNNHPILQIIIDAYKWRHCEVGSIHAGLECGILQERFKQMGLGEIAMASIGPSIFSPHSLQERLDLGSFEEFIEVLKCALDNICTQNI